MVAGARNQRDGMGQSRQRLTICLVWWQLHATFRDPAKLKDVSSKPPYIEVEIVLAEEFLPLHDRGAFEFAGYRVGHTVSPYGAPLRGGRVAMKPRNFKGHSATIKMMSMSEIQALKKAVRPIACTPDATSPDADSPAGACCDSPARDSPAHALFARSPRAPVGEEGKKGTIPASLFECGSGAQAVRSLCPAGDDRPEHYSLRSKYDTASA